MIPHYIRIKRRNIYPCQNERLSALGQGSELHSVPGRGKGPLSALGPANELPSALGLVKDREVLLIESARTTMLRMAPTTDASNGALRRRCPRGLREVNRKKERVEVPIHSAHGEENGPSCSGLPVMFTMMPWYQSE